MHSPEVDAPEVDAPGANPAGAGPAARTFGALLALAAATAAATLAARHPLAPVAVGLLAAIWVVVAWLRPHAWLLVVPALLPVADLSPWTGWIAFDEFDILLLATVAAGHARRAWRGDAASPRVWLAMAAGVVLFCAPGAWRGLLDAGSWRFGAFDAAVDPGNTLRVVKSTLYVLALLPMIEAAWRVDTALANRRLASGVLAGLALASAVVLWERAAYPGLLDTSEPYRTTAAFWEMHVGGAAIDGYLALATPFVAWALWSARRKRQWLAAAVLALVVGYACLTTFSRGVYAAVGLPMLLLAGWLWARRCLSRLRWRTAASVLLIGLIAVETFAVLAPDSFMLKRMGRSQRDYVGRVAHWERGLALRGSAVDRWLGIGLGRLPAHYANASGSGEFPGAARWVAVAGGGGAVRIDGPKTRSRIGGMFGLTQQVPHRTRYVLSADLRSATGIELYARVCTVHLLYDEDCQRVFVDVPAAGDGWHHLTVPLAGAPLAPGTIWPGRGTVLTVSVANAGGSADVDNLRLVDAAGHDLVANGRFDRDLARWWPAAQFYFLPWHIDNLYLELLIERGWLGLGLGVGLIVLTLRRLAAVEARAAPSLAPFLAAAILGAAMVGAVSSLLDAPRTAFLLGLLMAVAWQLPLRPIRPDTPPMP